MKKLCGISSGVSFAILCMLMAYAVFWGVGNPLSFGGLSVWSILLLAFCAAACIPACLQLPRICKDKFFWILIAFGAWVAFCAVRGFLAGNNRAAIIRDLSGVLYFAFYPFIYTVIKDRNRAHMVMKTMMYAAFALALLQLALFFMYLIKPEQFALINNYFIGINYLNYTRISATIPRLLFVSMPFQLCGCAFSIYFQTLEKKFRFHYSCITGVCLNAMVLTFTRALYLSAALAALCIVAVYLVLLKKEQRKMLLLQLAVAVGVFVLVITLLGTVGKTNYLDYAIKRVTVSLSETNAEEPVQTLPTETEPVATEPIVTEPVVTEPVTTEPTVSWDYEADHYLHATWVSDQYRAAIKAELNSLISNSPVIGNGMGIAMVTKQDWPEYSYLDLLAKMGVVGLVLYLLPILLMACTIVKDMRTRTNLMSVAWFAVMLGLMIYSIFQPYLNNVQCVLIYCCTLCVHAVERSTDEHCE